MFHFITIHVSGDKGSVTVMGHGTGAACLHYLMTSDALPHGEMDYILLFLYSTQKN